MIKRLNLGEIRTDEAAKVFAGRVRGAACREHFHLDDLDSDAQVKVEIDVPKDILAITTSFFLSFLGRSIRRAGSQDAFNRKFTINCPEFIKPSLYESVDRALKEPGTDAVSTALSA